MPLFQKSVLNKYLKAQDHKAIEVAFGKFSEHFLNSKMQQEIKDMKEEEYQDGFLDDLFVNVLGYTKRPKDGYNLIREKKNETDGKKADGAILKNESTLAVIELKGTDTTDLDKITNQAFGYKNNHSDCVYIVTSNFEKLRFFIHNAVEYIEFNLFTLTEEKFSILWLCLHADNLLGNTPLKAQEGSIVVEENITKKLYKDYATFKTELWQNVCKNNPEKDQLLLFKKTQKLLDRFLFIFFAEDSGLLPFNSISSMVDRYEQLIELDAQKPLYDIFKQYFDYINTGREGKNRQDDIFAYNGGLFFPDEIIEEFKIDDDLLKKHVLKLTAYDFQSDVDVNILGHIFENSLNEIENVTAMLEGQEIDKSKTKRKKDGVFYTPKYITKYIVDNTVGKLCEDKKTELGIIDEEYAKGRRNRKKDTIKKLDTALQTYREWLMNITICDPACGSGSFLNQALEFLIEEHAYIDELNAQLMGASIVFQDVSNHILENNIYGVDINDESVDIAKLSLWLRTAQKGRKLTSLNNNIKCGNSLVDDPEIAGEKAFNWQQEFPKIFAKGGFDVIIGNPPYVQVSEYQEYYSENYYTSKCGDLYAVFYEKGFEILKNKGAFSFITPSLFIKGIRYETLRTYLLENTEIIDIDDKGDGVFADVQMPTAIFVAIKNKLENQDWLKYIPGGDLTSKMLLDSKPLEEFSSIKRGLEIGKNKVHSYNTEPVKILTGEDVERYGIKSYQSIETKIYDEFKKDNKFFESKRIVIRETGNRITSLIVDENVQQNRSLYSILIDEDKFKYEYFLAIINSTLMQFFYKSKFAANTDVFPKIRIAQVKDLPMKIASSTIQNSLIIMVNQITELKSELEKIGSSFMQLLINKYSITSNRKLQNWHELGFGEFLKELEKARKKAAKENEIEYKKLSLSEEAEWMQYFNKQKEKAQNLKREIDKTDREIDQMVYELYGLTDEDIEIVANN